MTPTLVVLPGLPGTGKSTVATLLIRALRTPYLRIDTIEQALVDSDELPNRPAAAGYLVGYALAEEQLRLGLDVIVECVNPLKVTRDAWAEVATSASASLLEVHSDLPGHRGTPPSGRAPDRRRCRPTPTDVGAS